jgi:hypothetical protein
VDIAAFPTNLALKNLVDVLREEEEREEAREKQRKVSSDGYLVHGFKVVSICACFTVRQDYFTGGKLSQLNMRMCESRL